MHGRAGQRRQRGHDPRDRTRTAIGREKPARAQHLGRGPDRQARGRDGRGQPAGPGRRKAGVLARIVIGHADAPAPRIGDGPAAIGVVAHGDGRRPQPVVRIPRHGASRGQDMRHRLQRLDHRQVVGGMHDGAEPMRHDRQSRRRWLAVQFGKEAGHAPAHRMPREGRARRRMDLRQGRAGRPVRPRRRRLPVGAGVDQYRGRDQPRCRQRRGMAGELLLRIDLGVAQRQQLQIIGRTGQRRLQRGETRQVARDVTRRVQMAQQALRPDRGQILRRAGQMRRIRPGQGQRRLRKARFCNAGLRAGDRGHGRGRGPADCDGLGGLTLQTIGPGLRQGAVVGLEGRIAPLALILHLEDVAVEAAMDAPAPA